MLPGSTRKTEKFELTAYDPDGDEVALVVTSLPARGTLLDKNGKNVEVGQALKHTRLIFEPDGNEAGVPYANFTFEVCGG